MLEVKIEQDKEVIDSREIANELEVITAVFNQFVQQIKPFFEDDFSDVIMVENEGKCYYLLTENQLNRVLDNFSNQDRAKDLRKKIKGKFAQSRLDRIPRNLTPEELEVETEKRLKIKQEQLEESERKFKEVKDSFIKVHGQELFDKLFSC